MRVLLLIATTCIAVGAGRQYKFVSVKYHIGPNGYWSLPMRAAYDKNFHFVEHDKDLNVDLYSYLNDPRFFILYDHYGNIAGIRTGYIKTDLTKLADKNQVEFPYTFDDKKHYESGRYWDTDIWYSTVLFVDPAILKKGGRKEPKGVAVEDVYLKLEGKWTKIPTDQCESEKLGFVKQGCFPGMGKHYFYKLSETSDCKDFPGIFLLYECGELIGLGLIPFGSFTSGPQRTWFEDPPLLAVKVPKRGNNARGKGVAMATAGLSRRTIDMGPKPLVVPAFAMIVPNRPECLTKWVAKYGVSSIHIFFKAVPRITSCQFPFQRRLQCSKNSIFDAFKAKYSQS